MTFKILITDGSAATCRLYQYYLEPIGCEIKAVRDPEECLEIAAEWHPNLITLGMELEGTNGVELCARLKSQPQSSVVPVVIISAITDHEMKVQAFEAGAIEYLVKPCSPEHLRERIESILNPIEAHQAERGSQGETHKVLIAEDSRAILSVYQYLLAQMHCELIPCPDGLAAWAALKENFQNIDLIISDIHMPNMDGREFAKRVRSHHEYDQIPLIMSSTVNDLEEVKALLNIGANDYVTKPFSHEEFGARVNAHLRTRQLMKEQERLNDELSRMNEILEQKVRERTADIREANIATIFMLAVASDAKDKDTGNHIQRVRFYSEKLAKKLGFSESEAEEIGYSSMMHDVGKISVPDAVLKKPGRLDDEELQIMRTHTEAGAHILGDKPFFETARNIAHYHHERFDGTGYPSGLAGEAIPRAARIVAVADIYDALSSKRVYKAAWSQEEVLAELINIAGTHLDPRAVNAFLELVHDGTVDAIRADFPN